VVLFVSVCLITKSCVADGEEYVGEDQTVYEEQKFIFVRLSVLREYLRFVIQHFPTYKASIPYLIILSQKLCTGYRYRRVGTNVYK